MENIEKEFERSGYLGKSKSPEFIPVSQKSSNVEIEGISLKKELREDSFGKSSMIELLSDELVGKLSLPENYKIIDQILEEEGGAQELADKLWKYSEKLGAKKINPNNNARDVLKQLETSIMGFVERSKKKGIKPDYKEIIKEDFNSLRDYLGLLNKYKDFEKSELNSDLGFLGTLINKKEAQKIKEKKIEYVQRCKEILEAREKSH